MGYSVICWHLRQKRFYIATKGLPSEERAKQYVSAIDPAKVPSICQDEDVSEELVKRIKKGYRR